MDAVAARLAFDVVALHVADDSFFEPNAGVSAGAHLPGGAVQLALVIGAALAYTRVRAGAQATLALLGGFFGVLVGSEAVDYTSSVGPSGDDFTGLLSIPAGLFLVAVGVRTLWQSRRHDRARWWRYGRRLVLAGLAYVVASVVLFPAAVAYVVTHTAYTGVPAAHLGAPYETVAFEIADGLRLRGWYVPSRNGAAVVAVPGRQPSVQARARLLARHGYGVLLFDRRGEGRSDGDPNV